jgi:serine/threonine-protein kinase
MDERKRSEAGNSGSDPLVGRVLNGRFDIQEPIGEGGMGKVYRAIQTPLGRQVAVKVLHPTLPSSQDPSFQRRFLAEAALTARLHHPNTVTVIDYGQSEDGIYFLAMEYLEGRTLAQVLTETGPLAWQRAISIAQQICRSLKEAHAAGVVHRDLKPANIFLCSDGDSDLVKVLDFGLVKTISGDGATPEVEHTQRGTFIGSPQYMSPEQARNQSDVRSDVYSLGVLLYHMLAGRPPFVSSDYVELLFAHHRQPVPTFEQVRPDLALPPPLEAVVRKCLEKNPQARYQSMGEVLEALKQAAATAGGNSGLFKSPASSGVFKQPVPAAAGPLFGAISGAKRDEPSRGSGAGTVPPVLRAPTGNTGKHPTAGTGNTGKHAVGGTGNTGKHAVSTGNTGKHAVGGTGNTGKFEEDRTKAYNLAADLSVVAEKVKAKDGNRGPLIAAILAVLLLVGGGGWFILSKGGKAAPEAGGDTQAAALPAGGEQAPAAEPAQQAPAEPAQQAAAAAGTTGAPVRFRVMSEPVGARVYYRGKERGRTPFVLEIPAGPEGIATVELTFLADGYQPETVLTGGSGDVVLMQKLQKRGTPRREVGERVDPVPVPVAAAQPSAAPAGGKGAPAADPNAGQVALATQTVTQSVLATPASATVPAAGGAAIPGSPEDVVPFGDGMKPPVLLEGKDIMYPRPALQRGVAGTMVVKCVIGQQGRVTNCRVLKGLPFMDAPVVEALTSRLYSPVTYQGRPISVDYTFHVRIIGQQR